jgi:hypothetical protein
MTFKMNYEQASALKAILKIVLAEPIEDLQDKQHKIILQKVYVKLRAKIEARKPNGYSISLTDVEDITWNLFWSSRTLDPRYLYEQNIISAQVAAIDKQYA